MEVQHLVLLPSHLAHRIALDLVDCSVNAFLSLSFLDATACKVFLGISMWCRRVAFVSLSCGTFLLLTVGALHLFEKRRPKIACLLHLRSHLTDPHILSLVFHNDFLEKMIFLGHTLLLSFDSS